MSQISSSSTNQSPSARKLCKKQEEMSIIGSGWTHQLRARGKKTNSWVAEKNESNGRGPKVNRRTEERSGR
ncbi:unnamed protein product [Prunus brigantina]